MPVPATNPDEPADESNASSHDDADANADASTDAELVPNDANEPVEQSNGTKSLHRNSSGAGTGSAAPHSVSAASNASSSSGHGASAATFVTAYQRRNHLILVFNHLIF